MKQHKLIATDKEEIVRLCIDADESWLLDAAKKVDGMKGQVWEARLAAIEDLYTFARIVNPGYMYGNIHKEIFRWLMRYNLYGMGVEEIVRKLVQLPRAHLKSHMMATWAVWMIVRHPHTSIMYISATSSLAEDQLRDVQNKLVSKNFTQLFPEYIHPQLGLRRRWNTSQLIIDHPAAKERGSRDCTIFAVGLTGNKTGKHADIIVPDDIVVPENAYTESGREEVLRQDSQFSSLLNPNGIINACGTRYHPKDIYGNWEDLKYEFYDEESGELIDMKPMWEVKRYVVEEDGVFLWPRVISPKDGAPYGFNRNALSRVRASYIDKVQYYAQYYNDPNSAGSERISRDKFQYANPKKLIKRGSTWYYGQKKLNIYASVDFAFSLNKEADYTAIAVIGIDHEKNIYVLEIDRFKANRSIRYFEHIKVLHSKWTFKRLRAEVVAGQDVICNDVIDHMRDEGMTLKVEKFRPNRKDGSKEERISAALEHRYENRSMYHFEGGMTNVLEEELIQARPKNDDCKDALAAVVCIAKAPKQAEINDNTALPFGMNNANRSRFGGY